MIEVWTSHFVYITSGISLVTDVSRFSAFVSVIFGEICFSEKVAIPIRAWRLT